MESKALRVINALKNLIINQTSAVDRVYLGRRSVGESEAMPLVIVHEGQETVAQQTGQNVARVALPVTIECLTHTSDLLNPLDEAHTLLAEIKQALFPKVHQNPGLIIQCKYQGRAIEPPDHGSRITSISVHLIVEWGEELSNPYA